MAWGYTVVDSEDMTYADKRAMKAIILQVCPRQQSQCHAYDNKADDVKQRVENRFSGQWSVIVLPQNTYYSSNVSYYKYLKVKYKGSFWIIFKTNY